MARDEQAMSAARLAAIRERWLLRHKAHVQTVYGQAELYRQWLDNVGDDETALLAEVERLRAREAALVAVVERVAVVDIAERITPRAVIQQARAVLASAGESIEEGGGDGA